MSSYHNAKHALSKREQRVSNTGLSTLEAKAYKACIHLSCANENCVKRWMYRNDPKAQKAECGPMFAQWKECFEREKMVK